MSALFKPRRATEDHVLVRWGLTALALIYVGMFLFLPLLTVFSVECWMEAGIPRYSAPRDGWLAYATGGYAFGRVDSPSRGEIVSHL